MNNDRDYIKELFDSDGIRAPESLSEDNMMAMLTAAESDPLKGAADARPASAGRDCREKRRARGSFTAKKFTAIAATVLVALFGVAGFAKMLVTPPDTAVSDGELYTFKSEREIKLLIRSLDSSGGLGIRKNDPVIIEEYGGEDLADAPTVDAETAPGSVDGKSPSFSETYLQVDDVDEADIIKTDGKYIYYVNVNKEVVILSAENGKTKKVATVGSSGIENYIDDIYIKGDRLITVGTVYREDSDEGSSGIVVYDISDRSKPKVLYDFNQTGYILSSRMVGNIVYLVTNDYVNNGGRIVPMCGRSGGMEPLEASDICCMPEPLSSSYIVLSAVDISSGDENETATKAVFGASSDIYCNDHNIYMASSEWDRETGATYTRVARASLDGLRVKFNGTARVRGYVKDQFSMNERDGYFMIATTSERGGIDVNNLFVLDEDMNEAGKVSGFARNESIKAVRFIGDRAYVITYEQIDPLFIIDLSDPADPRIEGEVKIEGFSSLLIPVSGDRLLGIGYATADNGNGGQYEDGLKLALFDISDPSDPKVLDSKEFPGMSSFAQTDHHALLVNSEAGYFAFPYEIWLWEDDPSLTPDDVIEDAEEPVDVEEEDSDGPREYHEIGVLVFKAGDSISNIDKHALDGYETLYRSVYIGDWIYALDGYGSVQSFKPAF